MKPGLHRYLRTIAVQLRNHAIGKDGSATRVFWTDTKPAKRSCKGYRPDALIMLCLEALACTHVFDVSVKALPWTLLLRKN
jgi:hypothetical protein